ncbi:hypothetical protein MHBO_004258 [Bonamia ostreae]|uniref:Uncharacterized protein n=1 Tax=Bonamia ostreae TaxID=126728 RepID=A0ABV2ASS8_9EUKA
MLPEVCAATLLPPTIAQKRTTEPFPDTLMPTKACPKVLGWDKIQPSTSLLTQKISSAVWRRMSVRRRRFF